VGKKKPDPRGGKELRPFNPLEKRRLAESIVRELLAQPVSSLPPVARFRGAGVYAIYYRGGLPLYAPLARQNRPSWRIPIYVGKAVPPGGRKGGFPEQPSGSTALHRRLAEHAETVERAQDLDLAHFACRYLVVDEVWIRLAELLLLEEFQPVWNVVVDGFGNHDPGAGRRKGKRPNWDSLHPGRPWAELMQPGLLSRAELVRRVRAHLSRPR
jgi:hypothetical protein